MKKLFFNSFIILSITMIQNSPSYAENTNNNGNSPRWGAQEGSREVKSKGKDVNLLGLAMAAMFASQCRPTNEWACVAAGLSAMDAMAAKQASNNGNITCQRYGGDCSVSSDGGDGGDGGPDGDGDGGPDGDGDGGGPTPQDIITPLENQGYVFDTENRSVTTPDGQTITANDFGSAESLMNKGMSAGQAGQAMKGVADVKAKALEKMGKEESQERGLASVSGTGGAAGGYASDLSSMGGDVYVDEEVPGKKKKKKKDGLSEAQASQLSKNFNGQPIGIGMGNLFMIVGDKYKEKRKKRNSFINKEY